MNVMDLPDLVSESSDDDSDYDALDLSGGEENYEGDCECIPSPHRDCLVWSQQQSCEKRPPPPGSVLVSPGSLAWAN